VVKSASERVKSASERVKSASEKFNLIKIPKSTPKRYNDIKIDTKKI
jgi:hypothetical protein